MKTKIQNLIIPKKHGLTINKTILYPVNSSKVLVPRRDTSGGMVLDVKQHHHQKLIITGPLGTSSIVIPADINLTISGEVASQKELVISLASLTSVNKSISLMPLIKNMIIGVTEGLKKQIKLIGVGYKIYHVSTTNKNNLLCSSNTGAMHPPVSSSLILNIGFSHPVTIKIPANILISNEAKKANETDPSVIELYSTSLTDLNNFVYEIAKIKPVAKSFKGTGILIVNP